MELREALGSTCLALLCSADVNEQESGPTTISHIRKDALVHGDKPAHRRYPTRLGFYEQSFEEVNCPAAAPVLQRSTIGMFDPDFILVTTICDPLDFG